MTKQYITILRINMSSVELSKKKKNRWIKKLFLEEIKHNDLIKRHVSI